MVRGQEPIAVEDEILSVEHATVAFKKYRKCHCPLFEDNTKMTLIRFDAIVTKAVASFKRPVNMQDLHTVQDMMGHEKYTISLLLPQQRPYYKALTNYAFHKYVCKSIGWVSDCYILHATSMKSKFLSFDEKVRLNVINDGDVEDSAKSLLFDKHDVIFDLENLNAPWQNAVDVEPDDICVNQDIEYDESGDENLWSHQNALL